MSMPSLSIDEIHRLELDVAIGATGHIDLCHPTSSMCISLLLGSCNAVDAEGDPDVFSTCEVGQTAHCPFDSLIVQLKASMTHDKVVTTDAGRRAPGVGSEQGDFLCRMSHTVAGHTETQIRSYIDVINPGWAFQIGCVASMMGVRHST